MGEGNRLQATYNKDDKVLSMTKSIMKITRGLKIILVNIWTWKNCTKNAYN